MPFALRTRVGPGNHGRVQLLVARNQV